MNDALSSVLDMLRLQSAVYFGADFGPGWGMDVPAGSFASFHLVVAGECVLQSEQQHEPIQLGAGDIVLFPRGGCHWLASSVDAIRVPGSQVVGAHQQGTPLFSEAPVVTRLVCGHFELDRELDHPLIAELPEMVHIRDIERRRVEWLASVSAMLMTEGGFAASWNCGAGAQIGGSTAGAGPAPARRAPTARTRVSGCPWRAPDPSGTEPHTCKPGARLDAGEPWA